mmetsp:Transcript_24296/g.72124  ORF Transcript_24296/g.72124 Transcript_24296/m.72124 type:complete len:205 (-) Transcript_24296:16-630(-)|eukprot:364558-Chlamydomonas_euryale.AAC.13
MSRRRDGRGKSRSSNSSSSGAGARRSHQDASAAAALLHTHAIDEDAGPDAWHAATTFRAGCHALQPRVGFGPAPSSPARHRTLPPTELPISRASGSPGLYEDGTRTAAAPALRVVHKVSALGPRSFGNVAGPERGDLRQSRCAAVAHQVRTLAALAELVSHATSRHCETAIRWPAARIRTADFADEVRLTTGPGANPRSLDSAP